MRRHLAVAALAVLGVLVWAGTGSALTLCVKADGTVKATAPCKQNETELKVVSEADFSTELATVEAKFDAKLAIAESRVAVLEALLDGVTRANDTLLLDGMNLQVVNGSGTTDDSENSLGNVIIGYNTDTSLDGADTRTGSHNLVIGNDHTYSNTSGVVSGNNNELSGDFTFVAGGRNNIAAGFGSFVAGLGGVAVGGVSFVAGGSGNQALGMQSFVAGGIGNTASGSNSFGGGGSHNTASGVASAVVGGGGFGIPPGSPDGNTASGPRSFVGGGHDNTAGPGSCGIIFDSVTGVFGAC